jgi:WD40 repeat protein
MKQFTNSSECIMIRSGSQPILRTSLAILLALCSWREITTAASQGRSDAGSSSLHGDCDETLPQGASLRVGSPRLHCQGIVQLIASTDGKLVAATDINRALIVWELRTGKELWHLTGSEQQHGYPPLPAFSPDAAVLAMSLPDGEFALRDAVTGREVCRLASKFTATGIAFSEDGQYLVLANCDGPVQLWDRRNQLLIREWKEGEKVSSVRFSSDGKAFFRVCHDRKDWRKTAICRTELGTFKETWQEMRVVDLGFGGAAFGGTLSHNARYYAVHSADGKHIILLDPTTGKERLRTEDQVTGPGTVAFSSDDRFMTCTAKDGVLRVWDTSRGKLLHEFQSPCPEVRHVALSGDGRFLAAAGWGEQEVRLWDVQADKELHDFIGHRVGPLKVAFDTGGKTLATLSQASDGSLVRRWDVQSGKELSVVRRVPGGEFYLYCVFSSDSRLAACITWQGTLHLWDVAAGKELRRWDVPTFEQKQFSGDGVKTKLLTAISEPVFSPDGKTIYATRDESIFGWETDSGNLIVSFQLPKDCASMGCFCSGDGETLLVTSRGRPRCVYCVDAHNGKVLRKIQTDISSGRPLAVSPDGKTATVSASWGIIFWDLSSGLALAHIEEGKRDLSAIAYSPDGRLLAVGGFEEEPLRLWHVTTGNFVGRLRVPGVRVHSLAFSPDSRKIALSYDNTALICDTEALMDEKLPPRTALSKGDAEKLWHDLAKSQGPSAYRAIRRLAASSPETVALLLEKFRSVPQVDEKKVKLLIGHLDDDDFRVRDKASKDLEWLGSDVASELERALEGSTTAEVHARLTRLLEKVRAGDASTVSGQTVGLRLLEVLEKQGSAEARKAIEEIADLSPSTRLKQEANAVLRRMPR